MESDTTPTTPAAPGRPGLSYEAYEKAYQELCSPDGTPPSQRQLRKFLGTGSNTTLAGYRRRIAEARLADELPPEAGSIDAEILALVQGLASKMAIDEAQVADDRVEEIQKDAEQRVRIAEATMEKRLRDTAVLEHRATQAESALADLRENLEAKEAALTTVTEAHQTLREDNATLTQSVADANRQIATQSRELGQRDDALETARSAEKTAIENAKAESGSHQKSLDSVNKVLSKSETANAALAEKLDGLTAQLDECNKRVAEQTTERHALQAQLDKSHEARNETLEQLNGLRSEHDALIHQRSELAGELQAEKRLAQADTKRLEALVSDQKAQIEHLQQTVTALSKKSGARK